MALIAHGGSSGSFAGAQGKASNSTLGSIGNAIGSSIQNIGTYSAQAAAHANAVSKAAQAAQGLFNQTSVDNANMIGNDRLAEQYAFNAAQAEIANDFTREMWEKQAAYNNEQWEKTAAWNEAMWDKTAAYNESMWDKSAAWNEMMYGRQEAFNREEAQKNRDWQKEMMSTAYQRAVKDMEAAGLNPILAVTSGISTNSSGGATASLGGTSMGAGSIGGTSMSPTNVGSAQGTMASGGLIGANNASESSYQGQMEYLSGTLGLISAVVGGISSAMKNLGTLGDLGQGIGESLAELLKPNSSYKSPFVESGEKVADSIKNRLRNKW